MRQLYVCEIGFFLVAQEKIHENKFDVFRYRLKANWRFDQRGGGESCLKITSSSNLARKTRVHENVTNAAIL